MLLKKTGFVSIPFISHKCSSDIKKELRKIVTEFHPQLNLKLIFSNGFSIGSLLRFKDRTPVDLISNVVYLYKCSQCIATYVGETTRYLHTRVADHKGVSPRTSRPLTRPSCSRIREHAELTNHEIVLANFTVLSQCREFETKITESVLIHKLRPSLNSREASVPLNILH